MLDFTAILPGYEDITYRKETRMQDDYSMICNEFCDFLSTLLTYRLIDAFDKAGLLEDYTYRKSSPCRSGEESARR